jgi:hypothetical protein
MDWLAYPWGLVLLAVPPRAACLLVPPASSRRPLASGLQFSSATTVMMSFPGSFASSFTFVAADDEVHREDTSSTTRSDSRGYSTLSWSAPDESRHLRVREQEGAEGGGGSGPRRSSSGWCRRRLCWASSGRPGCAVGAGGDRLEVGSGGSAGSVGGGVSREVENVWAAS